MKLNVGERLILMGVLPSENNFLTLKIVRGLVEKLGLKDEEFKEFEIIQEGNNVRWNTLGNDEREIQIGEKETDIIIEALKKLNNENKLTQRHFTLYEKFVKE